MRVGVFHPGTQHSWQTALAFQEGGRLAWFATSVFYDPSRWPYRAERWLPKRWGEKLGREFRRRSFPRLDLNLVRPLGWWEWAKVGAGRMGAHRLSRWISRREYKAFARSVIRLIEREPVDVVWGFNTSCRDVFRWAKRRGIRCILDQTIGHPAAMNEVMLSEQELHPEFFHDSYRPFDAEHLDRQDEEAELADLILVGSEFCGRTMIENGAPPEKVLVVPYGFDEGLFPDERPRRAPLAGRPLRFLFAGTIEPRKGVAHLLKAFDSLPRDRAELTLLGRVNIPEPTFARHRARIRHIPQVPRSEVAAHFREADCLVFPSLFEGSAIVLHEACGSGLGIIQTQACGDGVRGGRNGVVLERPSADAVAGAVREVLDRPEMLEDWQEASWAMRGGRDWAGYRRGVRAAVGA